MNLLLWASFLVTLGFSTCVQMQESDFQTERPITKVIRLMNEMMDQLEKEQEEDEEIAQKMECWCKKNDEGTTKSINDARDNIGTLTASIASLSEKGAGLTQEIADLNTEVTENQDALNKATELRTKELAEFNTNEKELLEAIQQLDSAITVLSRNHQSFLQTNSHLDGVAASIEYVVNSQTSRLVGVLTKRQQEQIMAFTSISKNPGDNFGGNTFEKSSYAPQSGEIFGILKQMRETFQADLTSAQKDEQKSVQEFDGLKATKEEEIQIGNEAIETKSETAADANEKRAHSKKEIVETKESLSSDEAFLLEVKEKCQMNDKDWNLRKKVRAQEMQAVQKAIEILSGDGNHALFGRSVPGKQEEAEEEPVTSFVQVDAVSNDRSTASAVISKIASEHNKPRLAALAMKVKLDAFTKVKAAINQMIAELKKQTDDEVKMRDYCIDSLHENEKYRTNKNNELLDVADVIANLKADLEQIENTINTLNGEIADHQASMKDASESREKEHALFQQTIKDNRETQKILTAALASLQSFYNKKVFLQEAGSPRFDKLEKNAASTGVMGLMQDILNGLAEDEHVSEETENDAQSEYDKYVAATKNDIGAKNREITDLTGNKGKKEKAKVARTESQEEKSFELEESQNEKVTLHQECDFVMDNFDLRQKERQEEVEALRQALAILSGSKFSSS